MERKRKQGMSIKDKITILIKKNHSMKWYICILICVALFAGLLIIGKMEKIEKAKAPAALTTSKVQMRVTFTGDIEVSDSIRKLANEIGYKRLCYGLTKYWRDSDYVVANVSGPVLEYNVENYTSTRDADENSYYIRPAAIRGFKDAGINILGFANDDAFNYGVTGIRSTLRVMNDNALETIGINASSAEEIYNIKEYEYINESGEVKLQKLAIFAVNDDIMKNSTMGENKEGIVNTTISDLYLQIYETSKVVEDVVVYVHFNEGESTRVTEEQTELAHALIDAGAKVVIGNSTTMQKAEKYNRGLILYGIGSLITDEIHSDNLDSVLVDFVVRNNGETIVYLTPLRIQNGRPKVTQSDFYKKRIQSIITDGLKEGEYRIMDDGIIRISIKKIIN